MNPYIAMRSLCSQPPVFMRQQWVAMFTLQNATARRTGGDCFAHLMLNSSRHS